ncbi:hypothetical protein MKK64_19740 [Methylobacterium sp. E-025]|jgi:CYTH domain-containing protein|uniref:hypothetical protein n=3 Tax=unclassified Methylobacterium TaxID=2615210 RepID=UPI001FB8DF03|nr:hypothetical protein [Methylobacterium sp. E-025]MCJ2113409.1 hypothetical protein [Methylobacterium sp. E-025]
MSVVRRFLVAPALVRLIRKERGGARITEGYFAPQGGRTSFVRVDGQQCHLVLITKDAEGASAEERTDVPRAHGDALLDVCSGKAAYDRTAVSLGTKEAVIDRYVSPGSLDLVSVTFDEAGEASAFTAPTWFGRDVTEDAAYDRQALALQGIPSTGEIGLSNAALDAVLDLIEPRFGFGRYGANTRSGEKPAEKDGVVDALRRIAGTGAPAAAPVAAAVAAAPVVEAPPPAPEPAAAEPAPEPAAVHPPEPEAAAETPPQDARIDDVIESLSQALGAAIQQPQEPASDDPASTFERWTVRPRRTQQT